MNRITLNKIPQKRVRSFISKQIENNITSFSDLKASYKQGDCLEKHSKHEGKFYLDCCPEKAWESYLMTNPAKIWNGKLVSFGLMLSKKNNQIMYANDPYNKAQVGQVYFINLKLFRGLYQIAVSHEILDINESEKYIELSYIEGGKSVGVQRIYIEKNGEQKTKITHTSFYKSKSKFRDRFLYPYFHSKVLKEYHMNMLKHILS